MLPLLLIGGGLWLASKLKNSSGAPLLGIAPAPYVPWSESPPSVAGSSGMGQTSPLAAFLGTFTRNFGTPAPYVPLSGPGGTTTSPGASGAPSGQSTNTLLPAAPGTVPDYTAFRADMASLANPQYWWMGVPVDTAIMSEDVSVAMSQTAGMDLSPTFLEASMGMVLHG
jgi:hypothetical protein